jgi:mRNA interferase MazF
LARSRSGTPLKIVTPTRIFDLGDVVRVPFPYNDQEVWQYRPALVVSRLPIADVELVWVLMITSASHAPWEGDVSLRDDYASAGLPAPSVIRSMKIATIESRRAQRIGKVGPKVWRQVSSALRNHLGG